MACEQADLAIVIVDASLESPEIDLQDLVALTEVERINVYNKVDLVAEPNVPDNALPVSAKTSFGIEKLKVAIKDKLGFETGFESSFSARTRHVSCLMRALNALESGIHELEYHDSAEELIAEELKECQTCLSEIAGKFTSDDLLGEIFSSFCIGK